MKRITFLLCFILVFSSLLTASDWYRLQSKYVTLEFNPGFEQLADSLVNIADHSLPRLSALHGLSVSELADKKVRIILTDAPDISNGFAISDAIVIYARSSMYMENWSGPHTWYKQVLDHELVHHLTFRSIERKSSILGLVTSISVPRWFMEGIAQYFAETWTTFRGDIYMKDAVLNGRFSYDALFNLENGRLLYAAGHAYVRYLADQFGDSSLIKLVSYNKDGWLYDFNEAFNFVYGKSPSALFPFFHRNLIIYYGSWAADYPVVDFKNPLPDFGFRDLQIIPLTDKDSTYLVSSILRKNHLFKSAFFASIKDGKVTLNDELSSNFSTRLFVSQDQQKIAFGRYDFETYLDQTTIDYDWFIYDRSTKKTQTAAKDVRVRNAVFDNDNNLLLAIVEADSSIIRKYPLNGNPPIDLIKTDMPIGKMTADSSTIIFEAQLANSQRDFFRLEKNKAVNITNDSLENRNPVIINKQFLACNQIVKNQPVLSIINRQTNKSILKINPQTAIWLEGFNRRNKSLITTTRDASGKTIFSEIPFDTLLNQQLLPKVIDEKKYYASWTSKQATADSIESPDSLSAEYKSIETYTFPQGNLINLQTIPLPFYENDNGAGIFLTTTWLEAMQRQVFNLNALVYPDNWKDSFISFGHWLKIMSIDLQSVYYHGPAIFTRVNGKSIDLTHDYGQIGIYYKRYLGGNSRLPCQAGVSYSLDAVENKSGVIDYTYHGAALNLMFAYELPSKYRYIFSKRSLQAHLTYFKSFKDLWDFSVFDATLSASTNILSEKIGLESTLKFIHADGNVSPSAITGIDQDYQYNIPRDFRRTQTIRGLDKDIFGNKLYWGSVAVTYVLAERSNLKLIFIPMREIALSVFTDAARIENRSLKSRENVYAYGSEFSFGFNILRFSAGMARATINNNVLDTQFYGRLNLKISNLIN